MKSATPTRPLSLFPCGVFASQDAMNRIPHRPISSGQRAALPWQAIACLSPLFTLPFASAAIAAPAPLTPTFNVTVTSAQDGPAQPDDRLTLREALLLVNGTLTRDQLSPAEQAQVTPTTGGSRIGFNLPVGQTTIRLVELLPPLEQPNLTVDGTTQPGYTTGKPIINEISLYSPIVAITPAPGQEIFRGLVVTADNVTIRGLSLYGFTNHHTSTASTPPADIFISHRLPPPDIRKHPTPANFSPFYSDDVPPQNVVIEENWLGVAPSPAAQAQVTRDPIAVPPATALQPVIPEGDRSAFGVSVFNGTRVTIRRNWIANHDGSGIITGVNATNLTVVNNVILGNGLAGMPDGIRLEGTINQTQITSNLICGNDGSGVYLFKPEGSAQIDDNQIIFNGRRFRRAAVYLMGSHHVVKNNQIRYQTGSGVVVAAYPTSLQNQIQTNRFSDLEGLSIDLVTEDNAGVYDYQRGDGPNPKRASRQRRKDTGNGAINAPQFSQRQLPQTNDLVQVSGTADPGSQIEIYRSARYADGFGPLGEPVATVETDATGSFSVPVAGLKAGEEISAIATHAAYGTSEPARNAVVVAPNTAPPPPTSIPHCTTPYAETPVPPAPVPPAPIRLTVPKNIHFGLDQDVISPDSARILDRIAAVLKANPGIIADVVGHTDPRASDAYNLELGLRRARNARNYLLRKGIAPERLTIRSQGERARATQGNTRLDFARDRRAEFIYQDIRGIEVTVQEDDLQIEPPTRFRP